MEVTALERSIQLHEREACEESLYKFLQHAWKYIDPAPFVGGWHLEAIAEHLEAITDGQIRRLIINVPPRTSKSSLISVAWPAWIWIQSKKGPLSGPQVQILSSSYAHTLSLRDSVKMRRLIQSPWYQKHWGDRFTLTGDVNTKGRFENNRGGYRLATSVDGTTTGEGGDIILADDANSATEAESDLVRQSTNTWWDESMSTRLNDPRTGAFVDVQQRLHMEDLTGHIVSREADDWVWLCLPMRYESDRHCETFVKGQKFWEDPRTEDGELLCPRRFSEASVISLEKSLGPYAAAGQLQQRPSPRGGGIIKDEWWRQWTETLLPRCEYVIASLDTAFTEKSENDPSALTIWGIFRQDPDIVMPVPKPGMPMTSQEAFQMQISPRICLLYAWQDRLAFPDLVRKVIDTCTIDKREVETKYRFRVDKLLIENKANGISVAQELHRQIGFAGQFGVELFDPRQYGDKVARVYAIQHMFSEGLVFCPWPLGQDGAPHPRGYQWVTDVIEQFSVFPRGSHDDLVDSTSMALRYLRETGLALRREEHDSVVESSMMHRRQSLPLYPA